MGMFDIFKKKNVSDATDLSKSSGEIIEDQDKTEDEVAISWDTLSFGTGGGTERSETPYVPQAKTVSQGSSRTYGVNTGSSNSTSSNGVPFVPQKKPEERRQPSVSTNTTVQSASPSHYRAKTAATSQNTPVDYSKYVFPKADLLKISDSAESLEDSVYRERLEAVFQNYRVKARVMTISQTDMAVTFGISPNPGVRINSVTSYKEEYALALGGRIEYEIPLKGTSYLGLHVFKENKGGVNLRKMIVSDEYKTSRARIPLLMGALTSGVPIIEDLDEIGHLLIGGETGSGKSVFLNSLILGMLYKRSPEDIRFILIDTNILNLNVYNGIPSMLIPVVTDPRKAVAALAWCSAEITRRTNMLIESGCKDIDDYNIKPGATKIPHIVVVIDEFAPVIETEEGLDTLLSLTTVGKAAGVHMIISTQKISSRTALRRIKESIHARVAFSVFSETESKAFLDMSGAENLSGAGDMVYRKPGQNSLVRIQGVNIKDEEVSSCVNYIKEQNLSMTENVQAVVSSASANTYDDQSGYDELLREAGRYVINAGKASIGYLQRMFKIGFNRAARLMDQLAEIGAVGEEFGTKPRAILMDINEFEERMDQLEGRQVNRYNTTNSIVRQAVSTTYDPLLRDAGLFLIEKEKASIGMLQRAFKLGFNRAQLIMDQLSEIGVVGPENGAMPRAVLMSISEFNELANRLSL